MRVITTVTLCLILVIPSFSFAAIPPVPGSCSNSASFFSLDTPIAISSVAPAVITSTVTVSGLDSYLWDLDLNTNIPHTFSGDLDITLTSPAGTVVTITSDNGNSFDNIFNGTLWDSSANPAGQVPYTSNAGLVTDHTYVNLTVATPLTSEESLAAFNGENPNGIWTLSVSDDTNGDGGSLDGWSLDITTVPSAVNSVASTDASISVPVNIPAGPAVVTDSINVATSGVICDVDLNMDITHTFPGDLDMTLLSPAGTVVTLTTDNGTTSDNVFAGTFWDDFANPAGVLPYSSNNGLVTDHAYVNLTPVAALVPEEALGAFIGESPTGVWTLTISDDASGDSGIINTWSLTITTCTQNDADSDGTVDGCDLCPADPAKLAAGSCGCGVADADSDGDTVLDCNETCPADAAKTSPGVCGCGVLDQDLNQNQIFDCNTVQEFQYLINDAQVKQGLATFADASPKKVAAALKKVKQLRSALKSMAKYVGANSAAITTASGISLTQINPLLKEIRKAASEMADGLFHNRQEFNLKRKRVKNGLAKLKGLLGA
jgi:subtilisin-like proprotein convertase family protein